MNISNDVLQNTLLNKIIPDLWPIIEEYFRTFPKFVIGSYDVEYPGYRMIEENDLNHKIFIDELAYFYRTNKGFPSVDDFCGNVLFCKNKILGFYNCFLRLCMNDSDNIFISRGSSIFFTTLYNYHCQNNSDEYMFEKFRELKTYVVLDITPPRPLIGLFVKND